MTTEVNGYDPMRVLLEALHGTTASRPRSLDQIIEWIDHKERMILNYEELIHAMKHLIDSNKVGQSDLKFYLKAARSRTVPNRFSPFSELEYREAYEVYSKRFNDAYSRYKKRQV